MKKSLILKKITNIGLNLKIAKQIKKPHLGAFLGTNFFVFFYYETMPI